MPYLVNMGMVGSFRISLFLYSHFISTSSIMEKKCSVLPTGTGRRIMISFTIKQYGGSINSTSPEIQREQQKDKLGAQIKGYLKRYNQPDCVSVLWCVA